MTQDTPLFKDTIANNIRIGKLDASDEEVVGACLRIAEKALAMEGSAISDMKRGLPPR